MSELKKSAAAQVVETVTVASVETREILDLPWKQEGEALVFDSSIPPEVEAEGKAIAEGLKVQSLHFDDFLTARCRKAVNRAYTQKSPFIVTAFLRAVKPQLREDDFKKVRTFFKFAGFPTTEGAKTPITAAMGAVNQHSRIAAAIKTVSVLTLKITKKKEEKGPSGDPWADIAQEGAAAAKAAARRVAKAAAKEDRKILAAALAEEAARKQAAEIMALVAAATKAGGTAASIIDLIKGSMR